MKIMKILKKLTASALLPDPLDKLRILLLGVLCGHIQVAYCRPVAQSQLVQGLPFIDRRVGVLGDRKSDMNATGNQRAGLLILVFLAALWACSFLALCLEDFPYVAALLADFLSPKEKEG